MTKNSVKKFTSHELFKLWMLSLNQKNWWIYSEFQTVLFLCDRFKSNGTEYIQDRQALY